MLKAISLYTGIGGLDFGLEVAGIRTAVAVEMDPAACNTIRLNQRWPVLEGDIHDFSSKRILSEAGLRVGEADLLVGGPPCQPFSKSGYWSRGDSLRLDDPRSNTLGAYLRVLRDTKPKTFLLENVPGLAFKGKSEGLDLLLEGIRQINADRRTSYRVACATLNAVDYGVPQSRERVFLVGSRDGTLFDFPDATHASPGAIGPLSAHEPHHSAWDAIGDLPQESDEPGVQVAGRWGGLLPSIPEGQNYLWHTPRNGGLPLFGWRTRYWSFLLKLAKTRPSWTIQAQPGPYIGPFHWNNRRLTTQELCRLQTFPEGLRFASSRNETQRLIGNAVPSLLVLAREIRKQLLGTPARGRPKLMPTRRAPVPPAVVPRPVPPEYIALIGDHADHPGTGKGRAARLREVPSPAHPSLF
jgi:DNA (cytosine-5)-methyltransferase 1